MYLPPGNPAVRMNPVRKAFVVEAFVAPRAKVALTVTAVRKVLITGVMVRAQNALVRKSNRIANTSRSIMNCLANSLLRGRQLMVVLLSSVFCLLAVGYYGWAIAGPELSALWGPRFACAKLQFECGEVPAERKQIEHDFVIRNAGWQPMHITAKPGCRSCSTAKLSKEEIAPGDTSVLTVTLNVTQVEKGEFKKNVLVNTDDPRSPRIVFSIRGKAV
jgi:hypothetical protein